MTQIITTTVTEFQFMWYDKGSGATYNSSYYRPLPPTGYYTVGDYAQLGNINPAPNGNVIAIKDSGDVLARPIGYRSIWVDSGSGSDLNVSFWMPIAPEGYKTLGCVVQTGYLAPSFDVVRCVKEDYVLDGMVGNLIWYDHGSGAHIDFSAWEVIAASEMGYKMGTFACHPSHGQPTEATNLDGESLNVLSVLNVACLNKQPAQPQMDTLKSLEPSTTIKKMLFGKGSCPLNYHSSFGYRWQHLQDMIRLPDANGHQYYMGTYSRSCGPNLLTPVSQGGLVFVAKIAPNEDFGEVIWCDELSNNHIAGGFNHPGDLRRIGNIVIIAGQNWDTTKTVKHLIANVGEPLVCGSGGQGVLFYDVTNPEASKYMGKMHYCRKGEEIIPVSEEIDMVTAVKDGEYYYLSFNGIRCRSKFFSPQADWELVRQGDKGNSPSPVHVKCDSDDFVGYAYHHVSEFKILFYEFKTDSEFAKTEIENFRQDIKAIQTFSEKPTFSLNVLPDGTGYGVYANVESDEYIEIEEFRI